MSRKFSLLLILLFVLTFSGIYAQDDQDWFDYDFSLYSRGDKTFHITMGLLFPLYFSGINNNNHGISMGGTGTLTFNYFLDSHFFVGGEVSGSFTGTRGGNMLYLIPIGVRAGYQFLYRRFEIPVTLMLGVAPQRYLDKGYLGPILKAGAAGYWRYNMDWSFGLNTNLWVIPQWPNNGNNVVGTFQELTLSARFHF